MKALNTTNLEELKGRLLKLKTALGEQLSSSVETSRIVPLDQTRVGRISRMDAMQQQNMAVSTRHKNQIKIPEGAGSVAGNGCG